MSINMITNTASLNAQRILGTHTFNLNRSIERLSSGYRINRAGDDAAGLQISENLRTQIRGSQRALDNVQDGINMLKLVDGALSTIEESLQRVRELTVQAANDTYSVTQRAAINQEINALRAGITQVAFGTQFNGITPITWNSAALYPTLNIQAGPNDTAADLIDISGIVGRMDSPGLNLTPAVIVTSNQAREYLRNRVDPAFDILHTRRATIGALINRMEKAATNLQISIENTSSAESRLRNVDVATESASLVRHQVLQQSTATVLAQANQAPAITLQLIGGNG